MLNSVPPALPALPQRCFASGTSLLSGYSSSSAGILPPPHRMRVVRSAFPSPDSGCSHLQLCLRAPAIRKNVRKSCIRSPPAASPSFPLCVPRIRHRSFARAINSDPIRVDQRLQRHPRYVERVLHRSIAGQTALVAVRPTLAAIHRFLFVQATVNASNNKEIDC